VVIPIVYRPMDEINHGNFDDFQMNKYIICIDYMGLLGRKAAQVLYREGYLTLYVQGGYDMVKPQIENDEI
jgi:hypothetical protein